jgi:hypothetical protein
MISEDDNFQRFADTLERTIASYKQEALTSDQLLAKQCGQFQELIRLEIKFREILRVWKYGPDIYRRFINFICIENGNILTSRPFFRERQEICIGPISKALKHQQADELFKYHFNYNFVAFVLDMLKKHPIRVVAGEFTGVNIADLKAHAKAIARLRKEIVELNMPLAIAQAKQFWHKAPSATKDTRFSFMDFVQIAADGLMSAVDKFVLPGGLEANPALIRVWRAVAIGRMKGNFIEMFSETTIHFFPQDKRKLYRANKHLKEFSGQIDFERLASLVNTDLDGDGKTTASELANLMGAASNMGEVFARENDEDHQDGPMERAAAAEDWQPDVRAEKTQLVNIIKDTLCNLSMVERKFLVLKGIDVDSI